MLILYSATIYIFTSIYLGSGFFAFIKNLFIFDKSIFSLRELMALPSTISAHIIFLSSAELPFLTSNLLGKYFVICLYYFGYAFLIMVFLYTVFRFRNVLNHKDYTCLFIFALTNFFYQVGGYSIIFYFVFIPYIYKNYRFLLYFLVPLFLPLDIFPVYSDLLPLYYSYLYGDFTEVYYTLGLGSLLRPILNYLLLFFMCILIIEKFSNIYIPFTKGKTNERL